MEILKLEDVSLTYQTVSGETNALEKFALRVEEGEFIALVGPSGCGKTTILSLICGLLKPTAGKLLIGGQEVTGTNKNVGYMLQRDQLFDWRTIQKNVELGLEVQKKNTEENRRYALDLLNKYGLGEFKDYHPSQLSGGMRQRAALIRTLATKPDLLLLDEPFSALDYQTRLKVCSDVSGIIRNEKKTAILVTHDISEAISMSDRIAVLTARPATVKIVFDMDFTEKDPLKRREDPRFTKWFDKVWKELQERE